MFVEHFFWAGKSLSGKTYKIQFRSKIKKCANNICYNKTIKQTKTVRPFFLILTARKLGPKWLISVRAKTSGTVTQVSLNCQETVFCKVGENWIIRLNRVPSKSAHRRFRTAENTVTDCRQFEVERTQDLSPDLNVWKLRKIVCQWDCGWEEQGVKGELSDWLVGVWGLTIQN